MYPPIFAALAADSAVKALIGSNPVRAYPFGDAPQGVALPYLVWRTVGGGPENYLCQRPDEDLVSIQVDCYAKTGSEARAVADAARYAIEMQCNVQSPLIDDRDPATRNYRYSFEADWFVDR